eukprot:4079639-Prorocentrum_lima.AAC.1
MGNLHQQVAAHKPDTMWSSILLDAWLWLPRPLGLHGVTWQITPGSPQQLSSACVGDGSGLYVPSRTNLRT